MKRTLIITILTLFILTNCYSYTNVSTTMNDGINVLVWSGNGSAHYNITNFIANASEWGYDVINIRNEINDSILSGIDILIINSVDYINYTEKIAIDSWYVANNGRSIWITGDSDYGGYWSPSGTETDEGVNDLLREIGAHIYFQDDAVEDVVSNDGAYYRVIANEPNQLEVPAEIIMTNIKNISMHGPTAIIPYSEVIGSSGSVTSFDSLDTCQWLINSSETARVVSYDIDNDTFWEGYPLEVNMSVTMAAIEWDLGGTSNKLVLTGEAIFTDYKDMFGYKSRNTNVTIQSIEMTRRILDWFSNTNEFTKPPANSNVLVWSGNGAFHSEIGKFTRDAAGWGYEVRSSTEEIESHMLNDIDVLIVNAPDYLNNSELLTIEEWFEGGSSRSIWVTGESDYGGYWSPSGTSTDPGVNNLLYSISSHLYFQDDAVYDPVINDGANYRVICNEPNIYEEPSQIIMDGVVNVSMHGPTAVIPYSTVTAQGEGTVTEFSELYTCQWLVNTSATGSILDQDFDDDAYWEGYPTAKNMSLTMAAIEWNTGIAENRIALTGESIIADYKDLYSPVSDNLGISLQNSKMVHQLLNWLTSEEAVTTTSDTSTSTTTTSDTSTSTTTSETSTSTTTSETSTSTTTTTTTSESVSSETSSTTAFTFTTPGFGFLMIIMTIPVIIVILNRRR